MVLFLFLVFVFGGGVLPLLYVNQDHSPGSNRLTSRYRLRLVRGVCLVYCISQFIVLYRLDIIYMTLSLSPTLFSPYFCSSLVPFEPSLSTSHAVSSLPLWNLLTTPTTYFFLSRAIVFLLSWLSHRSTSLCECSDICSSGSDFGKDMQHTGANFRCARLV